MMQPVARSTAAPTPVAADQADCGELHSDQADTSDAAKLSLNQDEGVAGSSMLAVGDARSPSNRDPNQQLSAKGIDGSAMVLDLTSSSVTSAIINITEVAIGEEVVGIEEKLVDNGNDDTNHSDNNNNNNNSNSQVELMQLLQAAKDENELLEFKNYELLFRIQELEQAQQRNLNICPNYKQQQVGSDCFDGFHKDFSRQTNRQQRPGVTTTAINNDYLPPVLDGSGLRENDRRRRAAAAGRRPANESERSQALERRPEAVGERELCSATKTTTATTTSGLTNSNNIDKADEDDWATRECPPGESRRPTRPQATGAATTNLDHHEIDYSLPHHSHSHSQSPYKSDSSGSSHNSTGEPRRRSKSVGLIESTDDYGIIGNERHNEPGKRILSHSSGVHSVYNSDQYDSDECASSRIATTINISNCSSQVQPRRRVSLESECEPVSASSDRLELIFSESVENCRSNHIGGDIMKRAPTSAGNRSASKQVIPVDYSSKKATASKCKLLGANHQQQQQVSSSLAKSQQNLATSLSAGVASETTTSMKPRAARIAMPVQRPGRLQQQAANKQVGTAKISSATATGGCLMASRARSKSSLDVSALIKNRTSAAATRKQVTPNVCAAKEKPLSALEVAGNSSNFVTQIPTLISQSHAQQQTGLALAATGTKSNGESSSPRQIVDRSATASSSMGSIRAQQPASFPSLYKCRGPVKKSMDKIARAGQQQTSVQRPSQVREQQQHFAQREAAPAGQQVTGAVTQSNKLASSESLTSLFVASTKTSSSGVASSKLKEAADESEVSCGKQQQVAALKGNIKQQPGEQIDGSPLCKSDAAVNSAATTSGVGCKEAEDYELNNKSTANDEKSEGTGNLLAAEKRSVSFANLLGFCVQSDADNDGDAEEGEDDDDDDEGDVDEAKEGEDDEKDDELDGNECTERRDGQLQQVDAGKELVAVGALAERVAKATTNIRPTNQCSKSLSEINAIADCIQVGETCSSQQHLQQQQQLACGQCKMLHAKLSLLLKDRKQLNEQLNELEEMENDSRLLSQKLTKKLTSLEQQLELTQNDLVRACDSESKLRFQNKRLHFELKERCDRIARLHAQLCSLTLKSSSGKPIGSDSEQVNKSESAPGNGPNRQSGDVQANNETNEVVIIDSTTTSTSYSERNRPVSDADESCASSSTGAQVRGDDSAYSKSSSSSSSHNGDSDVDEHNTAQQTPTNGSTSPVDESVKGEDPEGDMDIAGKDESSTVGPVLAARQQVHRKRISTARILRGNGTNYTATCEVVIGQQNAGAPSSSITLAKAHVVRVAPNENDLSAQLTSCRQTRSPDETTKDMAADDNSAFELTLKGVAELERGSNEPLRRLVADQVAICSSLDSKSNDDQSGSQAQTSIIDSSKQQPMNGDEPQRAAGGDQQQAQAQERRQVAAVDKEICNLKDEIANLRTRLLQVQTLNDNLVEELRNKINQARKSSTISQAQISGPRSHPSGRRSSVILINSPSSSSLEAALTTTQTTSATVRCTINGPDSSGSNKISQQVWQPRTVIVCNGPEGTSNAASPVVVESSGGSGRYTHNNDLRPATKGGPSSVQHQQQQQWHRQQLEDVAHFLRSLFDKIHFHHGRTFELASECQRVAMSALLVGTCESCSSSSNSGGSNGQQKSSRLASLVHHNNVVMAGSKAAIQRQLVDTCAAATCNMTQQVAATTMQQYPVRPPPRRRNNFGRNSMDGTCSGHDSSGQQQQYPLSSNVSNCAATVATATGSMTMNQTNQWQPIVATGFNNNKSSNTSKNGHSPNAYAPESQQQQHQKQSALQVAKQTLFALVPIYGSAGSSNSSSNIGRSVNDGSGKNPGASGYSVDGSKNKKHISQANSESYNSNNCMSTDNGATGSSSLMCSDSRRAQSAATTTMTTTDDHSFNLNHTDKQTYTNASNANYRSDYKGNRRQPSCDDLAVAHSAVSKLEIQSHHQASVNVATTADDLTATRPMSLSTINLDSTQASDTVHVDIKWKRQPLVQHHHPQERPQLTDSTDSSLHVLPISDYHHQHQQQQQSAEQSSQGEDIERLRVHLNGQLLDLVTRQNWCESLIMDKLKAIEQIIASTASPDFVAKPSKSMGQPSSTTPQLTGSRPLPNLPVQSLGSQQRQMWCPPVAHDADHSYAAATTKTTSLTAYSTIQSSNSITANNYTISSNHHKFANDNNGSLC